MAHPDRSAGRQAGQQRLVADGTDGGRAVLAPLRRSHPTAELMGHQLDAVADAQDRDPSLPQPRVGLRRVGVVDRCRSAGQDDAHRPAPLDLVPRRVMGEQHRIDVQLPDPPRDELGVLPAEVEHDDRLRVRWLPFGPIDRCMEGLLEVGLDLEVVRGQDAVPGIRLLAVDGPAARRHRSQLAPVP